MLTTLIKKTFGTKNDRTLKAIQKTVALINKLEPELSILADSELKNKTQEFKDRLQKGETLDDILPEAFAVVREVGKRTLNMRHFDVQMIGGIVLHSGKIAEMRTGEGKTLVATLPAYLNALSGNGVHLVTVNDYLAKRDAEWMGPIYRFLGLTVGVIQHGMRLEEKKLAYNCDIIFGTNNEFGFDLLRDNMAFSQEDLMQRKLYYAIVDEVDSILIDEARTPLIISGSDQDSSELYVKINKLVPQLIKQEEKDGEGDFAIDEKSKQIFLTEDGYSKVEELLIKAKLLEENGSLYAANNIALMHHITAALKAHFLFKKNVDYIVKNGEVVIVDEHTGRTMPGRRWSDGLHQAVEAKEKVKIQNENQTLASITFQNYFRMYDKLSGMTGTADTEAYEFQQIYGLEVVVIPTNLPTKRDDMTDLVYLTVEQKIDAIIEDIQDCVERKQPVLVGTISIEMSEYLSKILKKHKIKHNVLNAKFHAKEAEIISEAGRPGAVTIATNMAGRGTDIVLGGNLESELKDANPDDIEKIKNDWKQRHAEVVKAGGLHVIGTERHESRRIDNQLRGRSGRQGDPGSTRFYLSVRDNLMRIFVSDKMSVLLDKLGLEKGEAITHSWVNKAIENAQRKVEGHNFDIRKQLLEFDNVANEQRKVIYDQRKELLFADSVSDTIEDIRHDVIDIVISEYIPPESMDEEWNIDGLEQCLVSEFGAKVDIKSWLEKDENFAEQQIRDKIVEILDELYLEKVKVLGENVKRLEKAIMLSVIDVQWKNHLVAMDYLRQSIHLRGYAQKDPKQEYKREAFGMFSEILDNIKREVIKALYLVQISDEREQKRPASKNLEYNLENEEDVERVGRNAPCPCGSDKKYKHCHGKLG